VNNDYRQTNKKHYTEEFKKEAAALVTEQGYLIMDAARRLDVRHTSFRKWIKQE